MEPGYPGGLKEILTLTRILGLLERTSVNCQLKVISLQLPTTR